MTTNIVKMKNGTKKRTQKNGSNKNGSNKNGSNKRRTQKMRGGNNNSFKIHSTSSTDTIKAHDSINNKYFTNPFTVQKKQLNTSSNASLQKSSLLAASKNSASSTAFPEYNRNKNMKLVIQELKKKQEAQKQKENRNKILGVVQRMLNESDPERKNWIKPGNEGNYGITRRVYAVDPTQTSIKNYINRLVEERNRLGLNKLEEAKTKVNINQYEYGDKNRKALENLMANPYKELITRTNSPNKNKNEEPVFYKLINNDGKFNKNLFENGNIKEDSGLRKDLVKKLNKYKIKDLEAIVNKYILKIKSDKLISGNFIDELGKQKRSFLGHSLVTEKNGKTLANLLFKEHDITNLYKNRQFRDDLFDKVGNFIGDDRFSKDEIEYLNNFDKTFLKDIIIEQEYFDMLKHRQKKGYNVNVTEDPTKFNNLIRIPVKRNNNKVFEVYNNNNNLIPEEINII